MNTERVIEAFREMGLTSSSILRCEELAAKLNASGDLKKYLNSCVPADGLYWAGVRFAGEKALVEENASHASPGGKLRQFGFTVIANDIGGNAIVCSKDGNIYWADHTSYDNPSEISYDDPATRERIYLPWTESNVLVSMRFVASSIGDFIDAVKSGSLESRLEEFDS